MRNEHGYHYKEGTKIGYNISYPNGFGGKITLFNVDSYDKNRIISEMMKSGHSDYDIMIKRIKIS